MVSQISNSGRHFTNFPSYTVAMDEIENKNDNPLILQLRRVILDAVDYAASALKLVQAQATALALSSAAFVILVLFGILAAIAAFVLLSVAVGMWLAQITGSAGWALLILGVFYVIFTLATAGVAMRWLRRLTS